MKKRGDLWQNYGDWLLDLVGFKNRNYDLLMAELHNFAFESYVIFDDNRARDGLALRDDFVYGEDIYESYLYELREHPCGVLEVLVALAIRIETEYIGDPKEEHPELIFWEMIQNLGLSRYSNRRFNAGAIYDILDTWIERRFSSNGEGSIFPLKMTKRDQRKIQIWDQMNEYLLENYPMQ